MTKKVLALILAAAATLSFVACGGSPSPKESGSKQNAGGSTQQSEPAGNEASEPEEKQPSGKMIGSGDLGGYHVEIKDAYLVSDYEGKPAIVVTYAWTNNSDDTTSAFAAVIETAFQDGVQLERAIIMDSDVYNSDSNMKDVRPGTTIDVQSAFLLTSDTSVVEFEVSEFISFSDDLVAMDFDIAPQE